MLVYKNIVNYSKCREIYSASKINAVILNDAGGIYGLTSIVDSLQNEIPVIATSTVQQAINVEDEGIGIEVNPGSETELYDAIQKLLSDEKFYDECVNNIRIRNKMNNTKLFSCEICKLFEEVSDN